MSVLRKFVLGLGVVVGLGVLVLAVAPRDYAVERSRDVAAPRDLVWAQVIELRHHEAWSPWKKMDPEMVVDYPAQSTSGPGAVYTWKGPQSGEGRYTILAAQPMERIETEIDFGPMGTSQGWWTFEEIEGGTHLTWGFTGEAVGLFGPVFAAMMDSAVGGSFEEGLAGIATLSEAAAAEAAAVEAAAAAAAAEATAATTAEAPSDEAAAEAAPAEAAPVEDAPAE